MQSVILHQQVDKNFSPDDADVLVQVKYVAAALRHLGHGVTVVPVTLDLRALKIYLQQHQPDFCFNLVESIDGSGQYLHFVPALLERMAIPFTGAGSAALYITTNKVLAKERMQLAGVATPAWSVDQTPPFSPPWIVKPISEDASVDIDEDMVANSDKELAALLQRTTNGRRYFIEQYISGREFNISVLASENGPQVLAPAEMLFEDYPPDKPRVVGYKAKWQADSFEFNHTIRRFDYPESDTPLLRRLTEITLHYWNLFNLHGYARVDFRVDGNGKPYVLEINANPCISPDSGFIAATERVGLSFETVVQRIVADAF